MKIIWILLFIVVTSGLSVFLDNWTGYVATGSDVAKIVHTAAWVLIGGKFICPCLMIWG